jgi:hypothetical protein
MYILIKFENRCTDTNSYIYRDDDIGSKNDDEKMDFLEFCPDWKDTDLWKKWTEYNTNPVHPS